VWVAKAVAVAKHEIVDELCCFHFRSDHNHHTSFDLSKVKIIVNRDDYFDI